MYRLAPHATTHPVAAEGVSLLWMQLGGGRHQLIYRVEHAARLLVPQPASRDRAEGLWQMTCFELFLRRDGGPAYYEFNFSPSQRWSAWRFDQYRDGIADHPMPSAPLIEGAFNGADYTLRVMLEGLPADMTIAGASAVIDERSAPDPAVDEAEAGAEAEPAWHPVTSLWAMAHPAPQPDFHHPGSFVLPLAPGFR